MDENPAQAEVLAALGARPHERPEFDPRLRAELREGLERRLAPVADRVPDGETLWVSKHLLSSVHGCEGLFLAQDEEDVRLDAADGPGHGRPQGHRAVGELAGRPVGRASWSTRPSPG